ncbi:PepSY domain-containing protein [Gilvimarinus polysaccharolyticus]|uniref:PepSY domain-containing protein n=1 Tax=Gilvimarinus polysaccharolyticus TaxID=863921 RepID=UPI000673920C|nr:PepSY domain-containing protein [Gilvimarinus polysaccharolyticus]
MTRLYCIIAGLLLGTALPAAAAHKPYAHGATVVSGSQCAIAAAKAGQIASRLYGGKVIGVKQVIARGRTAFRVKLLQPNGRIHSVLIDANSGQPLK